MLAVIYITLTSGVAVNVHYCMGRIAGTTYGLEDDHQCDQCGMEQKDGCCQTEHKLVKADDDHISSKSVSADAPVFTAVATEISGYLTPLIPGRAYLTPRYHAPPGIQSNDLCVLNSVFRM